jgi:hypothetical protein
MLLYQQCKFPNRKHRYNGGAACIHCGYSAPVKVKKKPKPLHVSVNTDPYVRGFYSNDEKNPYWDDERAGLWSLGKRDGAEAFRELANAEN